MRRAASILLLLALASLAYAAGPRAAMLLGELPPYGAVGEWRFLSGQPLADESGRGRNLTQVGGNSIADGILSNVSNAYLTVTNYPELDGATEMSAFAWIRTTAGDNRGIVAKYIAESGARCFNLTVSPSSWAGSTGNELSAVVSENGIAYRGVVSSAQITDGEWHHVGMTFVAPDNLVTWVDGKADVAFTPYANAVASIRANAATPLGIGSYHTHGSVVFVGDIADVSVFRRALSFDEIQRDYLGGPPQ